MPERVCYRTDRVASEEQYLNTVTVQGPDCPVPPWSRTAGRAAHTAALSFPQEATAMMKSGGQLRLFLLMMTIAAAASWS
jgi:hypothetical protein